MSKEKIRDIVDENKDLVIGLGRKIFENPELGYKEFKTKETIKDFLRYFELSDFKEYAITGMKATVGKGDGLHIGLLCDMDAIPTSDHPLANEDDYAAHSCGHNSQMAIMMGVFKSIYDSGILDKANARLSLITAPAEEFVDFDYRLNLLKEGKIKAFSGKQNLILEGAFDDIDLVLSSHGNNQEGVKFDTNISCNGFTAKTAIFKGKSAHAGAYPHEGHNALNAAMLALSAASFLRETYQDDNHVRFHPIIKKGGTTVNTVPDRVIVETYIRAANVEAIKDANDKIDNAFKHSALALSCECEIEDIQGYLPSNYYSPLSNYIAKNAGILTDKENIINGGKTFASDDLADVSNILPVGQIGYSGFSGDFHGPNFQIADPEIAYIMPAKILSMTIVDMLENIDELKAELSKFKPVMTKEEYIKNWLKI